MQTNIQKAALIFLCCFLPVTTFTQPGDLPKQLKGFDQYMQQAPKDWNAPGAGVGIVVKGKLVVAKDYGYRDYEKKLPVTPNTLYQIAYSTLKNLPTLHLNLL